MNEVNKQHRMISEIDNLMMYCYDEGVFKKPAQPAIDRAKSIILKAIGILGDEFPRGYVSGNLKDRIEIEWGCLSKGLKLTISANGDNCELLFTYFLESGATKRIVKINRLSYYLKRYFT